MMIFNLFKQLANITGLPPLVFICGLVILISLTLFGIFILAKVRSIKKVLNHLNDRLDVIGQKLDRQSGEFENIHPFEDKLRFPINDEAAGGIRNLETNNRVAIALRKGSEEQRLNTEMIANILDLLDKSGEPTPYHELTKHLSKQYPGCNHDFLLKEMEDLQKDGRVEVQLVAGKLYFQTKKK